MFNLFSSNNNKWDSLKSHKTVRIRNRPINIDDRYILYSTDCKVGENGIALYDINNDTYNITKYPRDIRVEYHSYCKYKDCIYIINTDGTVIVFHIKTKQFQYIEDIKNKQEIGAYSSCINIEGTDIIHIFGGLQNQYHIIYDIVKNEYVKKQDFGLKMESPSIIYLKQKKKLIIFCGYLVFIGCININSIKWEICNTLKIPNGCRDCGYILYGNQYLLLFGGCAANKAILNDIYLINLEKNSIEKQKNIQCPKKDKYHAVLIKDRIHLFGLFNYTKHHSLPINKLLNHDKEIKMDEKEEKKEEEEEEEKKEKKEKEEIRESEEIINLKKQIESLEKENKALKNENIALKMKVENNMNMNNEVAVWLRSTVKLPQYIHLFIQNGIDELIVVQTMTENELEKNVGITTFGHRKKILIYIEKLNEKNEGKHTEYI